MGDKQMNKTKKYYNDKNPSPHKKMETINV